MHEISSAKWHIFELGPDRVGIVVLNSLRTANRLNAILTRYDDSVRFANEDEPLFIAAKSQMARVAAVLRIKQLPGWAQA